jgi:phage terminase small subunit
MGAPKKPMALRVIAGTDKKNKHRNNNDEPVPTCGIGPAPKHLNPKQRAIWDEIVGMSCPGVLGESDRIALEMLCRLVHDMRDYSNLFNAARYTQLSGMLGRFGMTPSDRTRIVVKKPKPKNAYEDL